MSLVNRRFIHSCLLFGGVLLYEYVQWSFNFGEPWWAIETIAVLCIAKAIQFELRDK